MLCPFKHKWVSGKEFDFASRAPQITFTIPYRTCERCGRMQRGIYDRHSRNIFWETMRESAYLITKHSRIVRKPLSSPDRLRHSLRLIRTRKTDLVTSAFCSVLTSE